MEVNMPNPDLASERRAFEACYPERQPHWWVRHNGHYVSWIEREFWAFQKGWIARSAATVVCEEMVEIAARALCEIDGRPDELLVKYRFDGKDLSHTRQPAWMFFTEKARACLTAALTAHDPKP